jgi:hypothetical protein
MADPALEVPGELLPTGRARVFEEGRYLIAQWAGLSPDFLRVGFNGVPEWLQDFTPHPLRADHCNC